MLFNQFQPGFPKLKIPASPEPYLTSEDEALVTLLKAKQNYGIIVYKRVSKIISYNYVIKY